MGSLAVGPRPSRFARNRLRAAYRIASRRKGILLEIDGPLQLKPLSAKRSERLEYIIDSPTDDQGAGTLILIPIALYPAEREVLHSHFVTPSSYRHFRHRGGGACRSPDDRTTKRQDGTSAWSDLICDPTLHKVIDRTSHHVLEPICRSDRMARPARLVHVRRGAGPTGRRPPRRHRRARSSRQHAPHAHRQAVGVLRCALLSALLMFQTR